MSFSHRFRSTRGDCEGGERSWKLFICGPDGTFPFHSDMTAVSSPLSTGVGGLGVGEVGGGTGAALRETLL